MISKVSIQDNNEYSIAIPTKANRQEPSFGGAGLVGLGLQALQECEKNPMINVAIIDMFSAILPRTLVESATNAFAGFEAFRRESSGLIVNCLIPSFITLGVASGLNKFILPKGANLASCWADSKLIDYTANLYENSKSGDIKEVLKQIISNVEGVEGKNTVKFAEALTEGDLEKYAGRIEKLIRDNANKKTLNKEIKAITSEIVDKTHVYENVTIAGNNEKVKASNITTLLEDSAKFIKEYLNVQDKNVSITDYAKKAKKLVTAKSIGGMLIILPLAASMQYINRWITGKVSGTKGAPIYDDFAKKDAVKVDDQSSKEGLLKQKIISISSMIGVGLLSMMKMPSWNMFEFKGIFPTMDQARIISTTTFASRMAAADDKNELAEATIRDIITFCSLYFLGDYAAKAAATIIQKKSNIQLLNETKELKKDANAIQKFWHWMKNVNLKSTEEVVSTMKSTLAKQNLTGEEIASKLKKAKNMRSACQLSNLGVSLAILGLVVPTMTRRNTAKKHAEEVKAAELHALKSHEINNAGTKIVA